MNRFKYILIFILLGTGLRAQTQLDEYLRIAAEQNPGLKAKYELYLAALEHVNQQDALPDPTVSFGYFISPVETRVGAQRFKLSLSQMFPWTGTLKVREQAATSMAKIRFEEFQEVKNQLFLQVRTQWLMLYELEREIGIMQTNLNIVSTYEPITKTKYESNLVSLADLVRVQISIDDAKTKLDLLKLKRKPLLSDFNTLLNRELNSSVQLIETMSDTNSGSFSLDSALSQYPGINAAKARIEAMDFEIELADLKRKPNIGVGLDYGFISKRDGVTLEDNGKDILMPMVSLSLPIFGKKNRSLKKEAELKKQSAESMLLAEKNVVKNEWTKADYEIEVAETELALYQSEIEKTQILLRVLTSEYSNNNKNFEDLLRTQQRLLQLELDQVKAQVKYQRAIFHKDYLTGLTLSTFNKI